MDRATGMVGSVRRGRGAVRAITALAGARRDDDALGHARTAGMVPGLVSGQDVRQEAANHSELE